MSQEKVLKTRIKNKHETEDNWKKAGSFSPLPGEIIIYDIDDTHSYQRIKVGDNSNTNVNNLPFLNEAMTDEEIAEICK